jgi:hypothetical protein
VLLVALGFVLAGAVSASALSVSSPAPPYPFVVPGDASGNPMFFDARVSGLTQNEPLSSRSATARRRHRRATP